MNSFEFSLIDMALLEEPFMHMAADACAQNESDLTRFQYTEESDE